MIEAPMLFFTNFSNNYLILGLEDNITRICYRTRSRGSMDYALFADFFVESQTF